MNYCHRCHSSYAQPGTCNCFAPDQPARHAEPPSVPYPAPAPLYPWVIIPSTTPAVPTDFQVTCGSNTGGVANVTLSSGQVVQGSDNLARSPGWE